MLLEHFWKSLYFWRNCQFCPSRKKLHFKMNSNRKQLFKTGIIFHNITVLLFFWSNKCHLGQRKILFKNINKPLSTQSLTCSVNIQNPKWLKCHLLIRTLMRIWCSLNILMKLLIVSFTVYATVRLYTFTFSRSFYPKRLTKKDNRSNHL